MYLPVGVARKPLMWGHLLLGQNQGYHLGVMCEICCWQSEINISGVYCII